MALETKAGTLMTIPDLTEGFFVKPGFTKTSVTDALPIYFIPYGQGGIDVEAETTKGPGDEDMGLGQGAHKVTVKVRSDASALTVVQAITLLATGIQADDATMKDLNGLVHFFGKNKNGEFFNLWQKPDLQTWNTTPGCSTALSLKGTKFHNGKDGRWIEYMAIGWMNDAQYQYYSAQNAAYVVAGTGLTGGTTLGFTPPTNDRSLQVLDPYFHTCTIGGTDMGILDDAGYDLELVGQDLQRNSARTLQWKLIQFAETQQASLNQQASLSALSKTDQTIVQKSCADEVYTATNARFKHKSHAWSRDKAFVRIEHTSLVTFPQITFGAGTISIACNQA